MPMKKIIILFCIIGFIFNQHVNGQCTTETGGVVCPSTPSFTSKGNKIVQYAWDSLKITSNSIFGLVDSNATTDYMIVEVLTKSHQNVQVWAKHSNWQQTKYNYNNYTFSGQAGNEDVTYAGYKNGTTISILGDSCAAITDTFYVYFRKICEYANKSSSLHAGKQEWIGEVFKDIPGNNSRFWGNTYNQPLNFSMDLGYTAPIYENNCPTCSASSHADSFRISFYADTFLSRGFYQVICNTSNNLEVYTGAGSFRIFKHLSDGASFPIKRKTPLIVPQGAGGNNPFLSAITSTGRISYHVYKDTGTFKAAFNLCRMDGDYSWGDNKWNAYVFDLGSPEYEGDVYQGWFNTDSSNFAYNWESSFPTVRQQSCGISMDGDHYRVRFAMKKNFALGKYKIRVRSKQGGNTILTDLNGMTGYYIANVAEWQVNGYDITSPYLYLAGDTGLTINVVKDSGNLCRISFVSCREPKNPGNITTNRDTVCVGGQVTLTVDTADGTETQWFKKACGGTGGLYIGSGASITVTMDTSTTFYVRNRNLAIAGSDTLNKLDLYSPNCSSKRITVVAVPSVPTAPIAQNACDNTSHIFTFNSVNAGSGGNQIQWALASNFGSYHQQSSGTNIIDTVALGKKDTIWIRSYSSSGGCFSSAVSTYAKNWHSPLGVILPEPSVVCTDTIYTFHFDTIRIDGYGNHIVWSLDSLFVDSHTLGTSAYNVNINGTVGTMDTIWWRSVSDTTGCRSKAIYTTGGWVNCLPTQVIEFSKYNNIAILQVDDVLKFRVLNYVRCSRDSANFNYRLLDTSGRVELITWSAVKYAPDGSYYLDNLGSLSAGTSYILEFAVENRKRYDYKIKMN